MMTSLLAMMATANGSVSGTVKLTTGKPGARAVVWLDGKQRSKPMNRAIVDQRNREFIPHISVVTVGTEISFPNNDTVFHNVFAAFDAKKFDLGMYPRGKTKVQKFSKPGLVALMCSIHSEMSAYVMVVDTPYFTVADAKGKFKIYNVPSGDYLIRAWHETGEKVSIPKSISAETTVSIGTKKK